MTRSHKENDRDHKGLANGTAEPEQHLPRYFAKTGLVDTDPKKTKKDGHGKGGWYVIALISRLSISQSYLHVHRGRSGDEILDQSHNVVNPRRRSNSFVDHSQDFKTKFETVEPEPVFEEEVHSLPEEDEDGAELDRDESISNDSVEADHDIKTDKAA